MNSEMIDQRNGITMDEYASFFQGTCSKLKTKTGGVNNRGNKLGDDIQHTSITEKFETFGDACNGYDKETGARNPNPSTKEITAARKERKVNAEKRSKH